MISLTHSTLGGVPPREAVLGFEARHNNGTRQVYHNDHNGHTVDIGNTAHADIIPEGSGPLRTWGNAEPQGHSMGRVLCAQGAATQFGSVCSLWMYAAHGVYQFGWTRGGNGAPLASYTNTGIHTNATLLRFNSHLRL